MSNKVREILGITEGHEGSDGDGVRLRRYIGTHELNILDPFLMLDVFGTDEPSDYIGGFPSHPHRGFETVTYMLAGKMRHKDNAGNEGVIIPGGVQWMSAGKGIVHSEMPEQTEGEMRGFQLWINLPASAKMGPPGYQEFPPEEMPVEELSAGGSINVVAGKTNAGTVGPVKNQHTEPLYLDIRLGKNQELHQTVDEAHNVFIYVIEGAGLIGSTDHVLTSGTLVVLGDGDEVFLKAVDGSARFLLVGGKPLNEPVARGGPFVMNTREEVLQAFDDYQNGRF
ncbi:pirin family protein [Sneathiella glossodoripedis]|uniref:pirin family protein n=1 Tax=Sneathiella glossodoripedis TaxID=418853 RepID=UPI00046E9776|nr:pirin family protein [Sneathiella glossodoripedis]